MEKSIDPFPENSHKWENLRENSRKFPIYPLTLKNS
jgi:hypothetical protein